MDKNIDTIIKNCSCDNSCKDIYNKLINDKLDINELSRENILKLIDCIYKNSKKNNNFMIKLEIKKFFDEFEEEFDEEEESDEDEESDEESNNYIQYNYNNYEDYDDELIDILKNIPEKDESINDYVLEKIKLYNKKNDTIIVFNKTFRYLESPEDYFTNNDIIELFDKDEDKAIIEFNKINDFKHILYIYRKINKINKKEILFNKIEDYTKNNKDNHIGTFLHEAISILFPTIKDIEIKKKYGIILLKYSPDYDIFIIIKPLCNELEMQEILTNIENNIDNDDYIDNNILNILCDYKAYDKIYDLIIDMMDDFDKIVKYCNLLKEHMPDKISIILKKNIEKILDSSNPNYYIDAIEYLKIYKNTVSNDDFISYTNDLVKKHGRKTKFKKLFNDIFK